eukprot:GHVN01096638.1.p2 GENE.GHVN01096638.1~~GHVN01096638.1.p2  ORF type:complete len:245 (-),score=45.99 GHVN01096638.1:781-1515(-)
MGSQPSVPLTVASVISSHKQSATGQSDKFKAAEEQVKSLSREACLKKLEQHGVIVGGDSETNIEGGEEKERLALSIVSQFGYWSQNYKSHPNQKRVANWVWIHSRYRDQVSNIAAKVDQAGFKKFADKLEGHRQFEDTQLFKYFNDHHAEWKEAFAPLEEQHVTIEKTHEEINQKIRLVNSSTSEEAKLRASEDLKKSLEDYRDAVFSHLDDEENVLLFRWLNLNPTEYATYRTYLSYKYAFMY